MSIINTSLQKPAAVVLGAAGFLGRHVSRKLASMGHCVYGVGHGEWGTAEQTQWGLSHWLAADISPDAIERCTRGVAPRLFVHCAGSGAVVHSYAAPLDDFERTVASTAAVLEVMRRHHGQSRLVLASSAAVYGDQGDIDLMETTSRAPISPYGFHKLMAEELCDSYTRFFSLKVSIVRLFSVYGEGLRKQLLWDAMRKFAAGRNEFFGTGTEIRDWIHVDDAASLVCAAGLAEQSSFEVYNGGHEKATTRQVLEALGSRRRPASEPVFTGETHAGNPRRLVADTGHARRQLGWQARVTLSEGLLRYSDWFDQATSASDEP